MQLFRCKICGDTYLGDGKPTHCPHCGAHIDYMQEWKAVPDLEKENLQAESVAQANKALVLELDNTAFYKSFSERTQNREYKLLFKALSKIESEHASAICKMLGITKPGLPYVEASTVDADNLQEALRRETRATQLYREIVENAPEPRMKELFTALIQIESDHVDIVTTRT